MRKIEPTCVYISVGDVTVEFERTLARKNYLRYPTSEEFEEVEEPPEATPNHHAAEGNIQPASKPYDLDEWTKEKVELTRM